MGRPIRCHPNSRCEYRLVGAHPCGGVVRNGVVQTGISRRHSKQLVDEVSQCEAGGQGVGGLLLGQGKGVGFDKGCATAQASVRVMGRKVAVTYTSWAGMVKVITLDG